MSNIAKDLTIKLTNLEKEIALSFAALAEQGKVWVDGCDDAIQLEAENIALCGTVFKVVGDTLTAKLIHNGAESSYSLTRCNLTDLIELLSAAENYGKATAEEAALDAVENNSELGPIGDWAK